MNWWKGLEGTVRRQEPLKKHTTFRIGGPAQFFIEPKDVKNLQKVVNFARREKLPLSVLGAGSNILVNDKGLSGITIRLSSPCFTRVKAKGNRINVGAGASLSSLLAAARKKNLSGLELLLGIPGTVGAALAINAGGGRGDDCIGKFVDTVTVMDYNGKITNLRKKDIRFGYRKSSLSGYIVIGAIFSLKKLSRDFIDKRLASLRRYRSATPRLSFPNAGCIFKNPRKNCAGELIDLCGLKKRRIGDAVVSSLHANYILNLGHASADDVLRLMDIIQKRVSREFNVVLKPEIKIWQ